VPYLCLSPVKRQGLTSQTRLLEVFQCLQSTSSCLSQESFVSFCKWQKEADLKYKQHQTKTDSLEHLSFKPLAAERGEKDWKASERAAPTPGIEPHFSGPHDNATLFQVSPSHCAKWETAFWCVGPNAQMQLAEGRCPGICQGSYPGLAPHGRNQGIYYATLLL